MVSAAPRVRFRCHCTKCQSVYQASFGEGVVLRRGQARPIDPDRIKWIRTIRGAPLSRGLCRACGDPVIAHLYGVFVVIPARTAPALEQPPVDCDVCNGTRVADQDDDAPKYHGLLGTYAGPALPLLRVLLSPGRPVTGKQIG